MRATITAADAAPAARPCQSSNANPFVCQSSRAPGLARRNLSNPLRPQIKTAHARPAADAMGARISRGARSLLRKMIVNTTNEPRYTAVNMAVGGTRSVRYQPVLASWRIDYGAPKHSAEIFIEPEGIV